MPASALHFKVVGRLRRLCAVKEVLGEATQPHTRSSPGICVQPAVHGLPAGQPQGHPGHLTRSALHSVDRWGDGA